MGLPYQPTADAIISAFECLVANGSSVYLAVPITSGKRLWELHRNGRDERTDSRFERLYRSQVLARNLEDAARAISIVRSRYPFALDPSRLQVTGWGQPEYRRLWKRIIQSKVKKVILAPGWQYSRGCVEECVLAYQSKIDVCDLRDDKVHLEQASKLIRCALEESRGYKVRVDFLRVAFRKLSNLATPQENLSR